MKYLFLRLIIVQPLLWCLSINCVAQSPQPGIQAGFFEPRPKILEFSMESLPYNQNFQLDPTRELTNVDLERNNLIRTGLNFPVLWKEKIKVFGSVSYRRETLNLVTAADVPQPEIVRLYQIGLNFRYEVALKNRQFIMGHIGGTLRSDRLKLSDLNYAMTLGWGKKLTDYKKFAVGVGVENSWGRLRYSPLFLYENRINEKWDLSILLPKRAKLAYYVNEGLHIIGEAKGSSARYLINNHELIPSFSELEYRQRRIAFKLGVEKQLYDWFWIGLHAGVTMPANSILVETGQPSRNHIYDFKPTTDRFLKFSVFIVPPQKLFNKLKGK